MSQNHHWVGQSFVLDHSHQPEDEKYRAGNAVDVSWEDVDPRCKHHNYKSSHEAGGSDFTQRSLSSLGFGLDKGRKQSGCSELGDDDQHQECYLWSERLNLLSCDRNWFWFKLNLETKKLNFPKHFWKEKIMAGWTTGLHSLVSLEGNWSFINCLEKGRKKVEQIWSTISINSIYIFSFWCIFMQTE